MTPLQTSIAELLKTHREGNEKFIYFLLAAAGAAIALALQKAEGSVLRWWLSFYCGCKNVDRVQASIRANHAMLELINGSHPEQPLPEAAPHAMSGVKRALKITSDSARFYGTWQFRLLIIGALFFIAWRVPEMYRIT